MKNEIDMGFVILHYKTEKQTKNCVNSIIKNMRKHNYIIVIVDNYSNNGSIEILEKTYCTNEKIFFIKSEKNIGFSRGNNLGIEWMNKKFKTKFIAVLNNDTMILSDSFYNQVLDEYNNSHFAVMGPKIRLLNNAINPICNQEISLSKFKKRKRFLIRQIIIKIFYLEKVVKMIKKVLKRGKKKEVKRLNPNKYYANIILHGCFLIFSELYFEKYRGFNDKTFLYHEEELLFLRIKKENLVSIYNPKIEIFHEEDAATNSYIPNERKRALFKLKNIYNSNKVLIEELQKMEGVK